jgi:hypothetical protein
MTEPLKTGGFKGQLNGNAEKNINSLWMGLKPYPFKRGLPGEYVKPGAERSN